MCEQLHRSGPHPSCSGQQRADSWGSHPANLGVSHCPRSWSLLWGIGWGDLAGRCKSAQGHWGGTVGRGGEAGSLGQSRGSPGRWKQDGFKNRFCSLSKGSSSSSLALAGEPWEPPLSESVQ